MSHAKNDLREAFEDAVNSGDTAEARHLSGSLWNCTDVMPRLLCDDLELPSGSNYAQGARKVRQS